jgi:hypothetical protein
MGIPRRYPERPLRENKPYIMWYSSTKRYLLALAASNSGLNPFIIQNGIMNEQKLKELVHYICHTVRDPSKLGKTKLNKILFYSDFQSYLDTGESVTGETYVKFQHGPVSENIEEVIADLESEGVLVTREVKHHGYTKKEYISLQEPNLDRFSGREISITESVTQDICEDHTASSISDFSHNHIWEAAQIGEEIPYEAALVYQLGEIEPEDMEWAKEEIRRRTGADAAQA